MNTTQKSTKKPPFSRTICYSCVNFSKCTEVNGTSDGKIIAKFNQEVQNDEPF